MTDASNAECLSDTVLAEILAGVAAAEDRAAALAHADGCPDCRGLLAAMLGDAASSSDAPTLRAPSTVLAAPDVGTIIDHYEVTGVLGRSANGVVVSARDTTLGRDVALKLFKPSVDHDDRRLLREAQAMATLSHPNVVMVHDVGKTEHGIYVAMETVTGSTLTRWVAEQEHEWDAILEAWIAAGNGLAAAHEAGLLHRDFKPDNVLVRDDGGGVLVTDFGLSVAPYSERTPTEDAASDDPLPISLTKTGAIVGTPRYMAPEQLRGDKVDARADQFAFAVSLYRALYDGFPFEGGSFAQLSKNVGEHKLLIPSETHTVPARVWAVLQRCLQAKPEDRYPDMRAVTAGLEAVRAVRGRRWRRLLVGGVAVAGIGAGVAFAQRMDARPCAGVANELDALWSDARRANVVAALSSIEATNATTFAPRTAERLDDYAQRWMTASLKVCRDAQVERSVPRAVFAQQALCLAGQRRDFAAAVDVLSAPGADLGTLHGASELVAILDGPEWCKSATYVASEAPLPTDERDAEHAEQILDDVAHAWALARTHKAERAKELATKAHAEAVELGHDPITVEAINVLVATYRDNNDLRAALKLARQTYLVADGASKRALARHHMLLGEFLVEDDQVEAALIEMRKAEALGNALGVDSPSLLSSISGLLGRGGDPAEALRYAEATVDAAKAHFGPEAGVLAVYYSRLSVAQGVAGQPEFALATGEKALAMAIAEYGEGPEHVDNGASLGILGEASYAVGDCAGALGAFRRARAIQAQHLGKNHPQLAITIDKIAFTLQLARKFDEAVAEHRKALAIRTATAKPDDPVVSATYASISVALARAGHTEEAIIALQHARADAGDEEATIWLSPILKIAQTIVNTEASPPPQQAVASLAAARTAIRTSGIVDWRVLVDDWIAGPSAPQCPVDPA